MLLRGMERYFKLHNLPIDSVARPVVTRDFSEELRDVRDALGQAIKLARRLLDPGEDQRMMFRRYVQEQLVDDRARRALLDEELEEDTPQESLFLLRQSFESLRTVVDSLLKLETVSYRVFHEVGNLVLRAILHNQYFRPFRPLEFCLEFDRVKSVPVLDALRKLGDPERRLFTTVFLGLFRLLHYLGLRAAHAPRGRAAGAGGAGAGPQRGADPRGLPPHRARPTGGAPAAPGCGAQGGLATSLGWRTRSAGGCARRRTTRSGCSTSAPRPPSSCRRRWSASPAAVEARLPPDESFTRLVSPVVLAQRLRNDLWVFAQLARAAERGARRRGRGGGPARSTRSVRSSPTSRTSATSCSATATSRHSTSSPPSSGRQAPFPPGPWPGPGWPEECRAFAEAAEGCFVAVGRRSDVAGRRFDEAHARAVLARFQQG